MKDITKEFFKQPKDYGRRPKENITRIDAHVSNAQNIYRVLGAEKLQVKIFFGKTVTKSFPATADKAAKTVREYGELYFLEIRYPNTGDALHIKLKSLVPGGLERKRQRLAEKAQEEADRAASSFRN